MKRINWLPGMLILAAVAFLIPSCSKDDEGGSISETDIALAQDEAYVEALYDDVDNLALTEIQTLDENDYVTSGMKSTSVGACYTVTVNHPDSTTFPKEVIIDFGEGCSVMYNGDTITRSGQIIINISNRWYRQNAEQVMTFNNFYFNGAKVEGTRTMTNNGLNEQNRLQIAIHLEAGKVTFSEGAFMTRTASHVREWARKMNSFNDTIYVTGSANGVNVLGETYNREITEPLVWVHCAELQYRWSVAAGKMEITNSNRGNMTIEHTGNGCDGDVVVEKDGNQYNYQFRYRHGNKSGS
jgi:hypothetical protein